ncbi:G-PROTEIN-RECEP-F1-2 domain-containing protein [Aphelenchoides fujianensis]|nr:G-PROTEIN-RECEP-F1-2 domain-containing protein [Aphelenchoides fujianensis]
MKSFTEKKLTALMIAICTIYLFGNLPQMAVMVFQNESTDSVWGFQVFRNIANTLEILNHCSNFFVFCLASSEYSRAFLTNCRCLTRLLLKIPYCAALLHARRLNSNLSGFDQRDLPHGFENSNCRRKSSLFYDFHPERKNTVCIQVTSSTSDTISIAGASQRTPSLTPFDNDCVVLRNQAATAYPALEPGDEYL